MKKTLHLLTLLLMTLLPLGAKAATTVDFQVDGVTYQYYYNKPWIGSATEYVWVPSQAGYSTTLGRITSINTNTTLSGEIEVKSQVDYNGKTWDVTKIDAYAFGGCINITKITLPASITDITTKSIAGGLIMDELDNALYSITGSGLFMGCASLKEAVINCNVTTLGGGAFVGCTNLTNVTLPTSLTTIDFGEFCECPNLTSIDNIDQLTNLTTLGHYSFYQYTTANTKLQTLNFPGNTITGIGYGAFRNCQGLTTITGLENVSSFNSYMLLLSGYQFSNCYALKELKFTNRSLTSIPEACFSNCQSMTSLTLPNSITSVSDYGFNATWRLRHITWLDADGNSLNDEEDMFYIPSTWTTANEYVCRSMGINSTGVRLYVPSNFSTAKANAFANVKWIDGSISEATTPPSLTDGAFTSVTNKTLMYVPAGSVEAYEASTWANTFRFEVNPAYLDKSYTDAQGVLYSLDPETAEAWVEVQGSVSYDSNGRVDDIVGSTTLAENIEIPATFVHDNITYTVVGIKAMAFARCNTVKSVTFPATIRAITTGTTTGKTLGVDITGISSMDIDGSAMFLDNTSIQSVTFQDSNLTTVGGGAFANCSALTTVTLPSSVTEIALGQFAQCKSLATVNNLDNVTTVGDYAFYHPSDNQGTGLTSIAFNAEKLTRLGTSAFYNCTNLSSVTGIENVSDFGSDITVSSSLLKNPGYVFANCYLLNNVVLSNSAITSIPQSSFSNCTQMTSLTLPTSVTTLKTSAFNNCYVLKHITWVDADGKSVNDDAEMMYLPEGITSIGTNAFKNVSVNGSNPGLLMSFPSSIASYSALTGAGIASTAFTYSEGITTYKFIDGCVSYATTAPSVASTAFPTYDEADKALLYIPAGSLSSYESSNWANTFRFEELGTVNGIKYELNSTTAEAWVEVQGEAEYYTLTGLVKDFTGNLDLQGEIEIPDQFTLGTTTYTVVGIKAMAFRQCDNITKVTFPNTIKYISTGKTTIADIKGTNDELTIDQLAVVEGSAIFFNNTGIKEVVFQDANLTSLGNGAFAGCTSLQKVTLPVSLTEIGLGEFAGCTSLATVNTEDLTSLESIGAYAFHCKINDGNNKLTSLAFNSDALKTIGVSAFYANNALTSITGLENVEEIGVATVTGDYNSGYVFANCWKLNNISLPSLTQTALPQYTFSMCNYLTDIELPSTITEIGERAFNCTYRLSHIKWINASGEDMTDSRFLGFPEGMTYIGKYAFHLNGNGNARALCFPSTLTPKIAASSTDGMMRASSTYAIDEYAFDQVEIDSSTEVPSRSFSTLAPAIAETAFKQYTAENRRPLDIPEGSLANYTGTYWANTFKLEESTMTGVENVLAGADGADIEIKDGVAIAQGRLSVYTFDGRLVATGEGSVKLPSYPCIVTNGASAIKVK